MSLPPRLHTDLRAIVGEDGLVTEPAARAVYECDGYTLEKAVPDLIVLPRSPEDTARVAACLAAHGAPLVPRGAGTSLAGGCLAPAGGVVVALTRLRRIEALDAENGQALVEAGVVNQALGRAALAHGLGFAPDPSSQPVSTVGGNIANNSGGPHTLKHGVTTNHVLAVELVTPDGERRWLGSRVPARGGPDLAGLTVGSEGTFGIVTRAWVRLVPAPPAVRTLLASFRSAREAGNAVTRLVASGIVPAAVEMMDAPILEALHQAFGLEFPPGTDAVLLVELDGFEAEVAVAVERAVDACLAAGAFDVRRAASAEEREGLWKARKRAFGALGRLARNVCTQDGVVPRSRLPEALDRIRAIGNHHGVRIANVFHAGDGNLHPVLLYDERDEREVAGVLAASAEILEACLDMGGSLTGEHGIGIEKVALLRRAFSTASLDAMHRVRRVFDPAERSNPGKAIPAGGGCADERALGRVRPSRRGAL